MVRMYHRINLWDDDWAQAMDLVGSGRSDYRLHHFCFKLQLWSTDCWKGLHRQYFRYALRQ